MGNPLLCSRKFWLSKFLLGFCCLSGLVSSQQCLEDQRVLLLEFKQGLSIDPQSNSKLFSWSSITNCCSWDGVTCDPSTGHVIGLDIGNSSITGGINSFSSLFGLHHLQRLNLAYNYWSLSPYPSGFDRLLNLTHLNLSFSGFSGQVPVGISFLQTLVVLDLSTFPFPGSESIKLQNPDLETFVKNLTNLEELYLDGIDMLMVGSDWDKILSTLSKLRILSLSNCNLVGSVHSSLLKLQFLTHLNLNGNNFYWGIPHFLASFSSLKYLDLSSCELNGMFPRSIFLMPSLSYIDVSKNPNLRGCFPEFPPGSQLQVIKVSETRFSGKLPASIDNLALLKELQLADCDFFAPIPSSFGNLTELTNLDFSRNNFSGSLPLLTSSTKVISLIFSHNSFTGTIPMSYGELDSLEILDLKNNSLHGNIPESLFTTQSIKFLRLGQNKLDAQMKEFQNASFSSLREIDLSQNKLQGPVPQSIFKIRGLNILRLFSNNFSGSITSDMLKDLKELTRLELSDINFSVSDSSINSTMSSKIGTLTLSSCNITEFPNFLRTQINLFYLDLSNNKIKGEIPNWIWGSGNGNLAHLNLSHNMLQEFERPGLNLSSNFLSVLDLHSNMLHGSLFIPPPHIVFLDYSENKFTSTVPANIIKYLSNAIFVSFSSNNLDGEIPPSLCEASFLQVLDLSSNLFSGSIPSCLVSNSSLKILKLQNNEFQGMVPEVVEEECSLRTFDVSQNHLEGPLPRSLSSCRNLEVLNVGKNQLIGSFPFWLEPLPHLRVLILRSNNFSGSIKYSQTGNAFAMLQILDLSSNNFSGNLPSKWFHGWTGMKKLPGELPVSQILGFSYLKLSNWRYQDSVSLMNKGQFMELVKILTIFTCIDISSNKFEGEIPDTLGDLDSLYVLNMSNNNLKGQIPATFGKLKELGSLDLSQNQLSGNIPEQLASLTFLSVLNLSQNLLVGKIPRGSQFDTFTAASFEGNIGLCGFPLSIACADDGLPTSEPTSTNWLIDWDFFWMAFGCGGGIGIVIGIKIALAVINVIVKKRRRVHKNIRQWRRN